MSYSLLEKKWIYFLYSTVNLSIFVACIIGVVLYGRQYFSYETDNKIAPFVPIEQPIPKLSLCFSYYSLFNEKWAHSFYLKGKKQASLTTPVVNFTVAQLFKLTPDTHHVVKSCRIRLNRTSKMSYFEGDKCFAHLNITKYIIKGYVCYMIQPKVDDDTYDFSLVSSSFDFRRTLFDVSIAEPLNLGHKILPVVHFSKIPFEEHYFVTEMLPSRHKEYIILGYDLFQTHYLPKPFETECVNFPIHYIKCVSDCINQKLLPESKLYPKSYSFEPINSSYSSYHELMNKSFIDRCWQKYEFQDCDWTLSVTMKSPPFSWGDKLTFAVEAATFPVYLQKTYPKITLDEFILQILTFFGVCLGASIFGLCHLWPAVKEKISLAVRTKHLIDSHPLHLLMCDVNRIWAEKVRLENKLKQVNDQFDDEKFFKPLAEVKSSRGRLVKMIFLLSLSVKSIVFTSLLVQISLVINSYMEYKTLMIFEHEVWPESIAPSLDLCFKINDLMNTSRDSTIIFANEIASSVRQNVYDLYTLEELYSRAPTPKSIINGCRTRSTMDSLLVKSMNSTFCNSWFNVTQYFLKNQICYKFSPRSEFPLNFRLTGESDDFDSQGIIYSVIMNPIVKKYSRIEVIVHFGPFPQFSHEFSSDIFVEKQNQLYLVAYTHKEFHYLPKPYDQNCYKSRGDRTCTSECLENKTLNALGYLPYSELIFEPYKRPILNRAQMADEKIAKIWFHLENECFVKCSMVPCDKEITRTIISSPFQSEHALEFSLHTQLYPDVISFAKPIFLFPNTLYAILCFISFWLGVNLMSLNPVELWLTWREKKVFNVLRRRFKQMGRVLFLVEVWTFSITRLTFGQRTRETNFVAAKRSKYSLELCVQCLMKCLCSIGCAYSIFAVVANFLRYPTIIDTQMRMDTNFSSNQMSVCFLMPQMGINVYNNSISSLFSLTPKAEDIVNFCGHRGIHLPKLSNQSLSTLFTRRIFIFQSNGKGCFDNFRVRKFLLQNFVCYSFRHKHPSEVSRISFFLNFANLIFVIGIKPKYLTEALLVNVAYHLPYGSSMWSPIVVSEKSSSGWYTVSYIKFVHKILPEPYDNDGYYSSAVLRYAKHCTRAKLGKLKNLESPELLVKEPNDRFYSKFQSDFLHIRKECVERMKRGNPKVSSDVYDSYITIVSEMRSSPTKNSILFAFTGTNNPTIESEFRPMKSSFTLFLDIGSIISICFGLSIISCNPFILFLKGMKSNERRTIQERISSFSQRMNQIESDLQSIDRLVCECTRPAGSPVAEIELDK